MPVILATWESEIRRIMVQGQPWEIVLETPISKITRAKMDWRSGSSGRMSALQVEFKLHPIKKKKNHIGYGSC
jgi:hypothetical protein